MLAGIERLRWAAILLCVAFPWVDPFAAGPSSSVEPWLVSAACAAALFAIEPPARLQHGVPALLAAIALWAMLRTGVVPETMVLAGACIVVLMTAASAARSGRDEGFVQAVAFGLLLAAALSTAIALVQYFDIGARLAPWVNGSVAGEAYANLRQRNQFATLTAIGMASLFVLAPGRLKPWAAMAAIGWLAIGNAATTSRTGLAEMLLLGGLGVAWPGPRRLRLALWGAGLAAYVIAALALPALLELASGVAGNRLWERVAAVDACSSRKVLWSNVLHLIAQRPWIGWGWGELDFAHFETLYPGARFCDILDNAHNLPLHFAVELGLPCALLVCAAMAWAAWRAKPWAESHAARQMAWAVLAAIGIHSLLEYPLWYGPFQMAAGLSLGLLWPRGGGEAADDRARVIGLLGAFIAGGACAYAAWDYHRVSQIYLAPEARAPLYRDDPIPSIRKSWLFRSQALFAELTITPLSRENAQWAYETARELMHYSPEPRVVEVLIESATLLGRTDEMLPELARFRAAFPEAYEKWKRSRSRAAPEAQPAT